MSIISSVVKKFKDTWNSDRSIKIYAHSIIQKGNYTFFLIREKLEQKLVFISSESSLEINRLFKPIEEGEFKIGKKTYWFRVCLCNHEHACSLRSIFKFTNPSAFGLKMAIGMGDRIGLASPGHIMAAKKLGVSTVLAQQSIREMNRTGRTPADVLDDVSWAVFQEGYRESFGADADHLKTFEDVELCFRAGYTMYTIDPSDYVDNTADSCDVKILEEKFLMLPWEDLECKPEDCLKKYIFKDIKIGTEESIILRFTKENLLRAACKYSAAIAYTSKMFRYTSMLFGNRNFDTEMSVDESEIPTSPLEQLFIASELKRLKVRITSLALRFVGRFEKAIDYIGDLSKFAEALKMHVLIAKSYGPYKLSIHSGSDKFSIFPLIGNIAGDLIHLKTAGTSYLEALRIVARFNPGLLRDIVEYSFRFFEKDRKSYDLTTKISMIPSPDSVSYENLEKVYLDDNNGRQLLHITYGSILTAKESDGIWIFRDRLKKVLIEHEEEHYKTVSEHLMRHVKAVWLSQK